jgi:hypothetical protein
VWDADNARELGGLHHTHSVRGGRAGIVDNPWVIGRCSGIRVCAGRRACAGLRSAQSGACLRLDGSGTVRLGESVHKRHRNDDDGGFGCSMGTRAPWTGGHQMDVSACDSWTDLHRLNSRPSGGTSEHGTSTPLTFGPFGTGEYCAAAAVLPWTDAHYMDGLAVLRLFPRRESPLVLGDSNSVPPTGGCHLQQTVHCLAHENVPTHCLS